MDPVTGNNTENKVKLMKMSKGHQWEISATGEDLEDCLQRAREIDQKLQTMYPSE